VNNVVKKFGNVTVLKGISFHIEPGEFVTLLGPSGCGKTTILRIIAGFLDPEEGQVLFNDKVVNNVKPNKRNTAMCFQSYALFPNKTVYENIRFGLRMRKVPSDEQRQRVENAIAMVNLTGLGDRKPYELSGGQQQRVALARAIVVNPDILLFDEPLSNLDAKLRERVRMEIREVQKAMGITTIYVTHDQAEALSISDNVIAMSNGTIVQKASPRAIYDYPSTEFVADHIGAANIIPAEMGSAKGDFVEVNTPIGCLYANNFHHIKDQKIALCIRPEDLHPVLKKERMENMNIITGKIRNAIYMGNQLDLFFLVNDYLIRASVPKDYIIEEGATIDFAIPRDKVLVVGCEK
jgi:ABC-type Fe3+/spermidine/putrescine transport system ATPase subunit